MIDFSDRFIGLMIVLLMILAILGYIAIFGKVDNKSKVDK